LITHADKTQENKSQLAVSEAAQKLGSGESTFQFVDNRPEAVAQRRLQGMANNSQQVSQLRSFQEMANNHSTQQHQTIQRALNITNTDCMEEKIMTLINGTTIGQQIYQNHDIDFEIRSFGAWTSLTVGGFGIKIEQADYDRILQAVDVQSLPDFRELAVKVAHEMVHVAHAIKNPAFFEILGDRDLMADDIWQDAEEKLTITGQFQISTTEWTAKIEALKTRFQYSYKKANIQDELTRCDQIKRGRARTNLTTVLEGWQAIINKIELLEQGPPNSLEEGGFYVINDPRNENAARDELGFNIRDNYADETFEQVEEELAPLAELDAQQSDT